MPRDLLQEQEQATADGDESFPELQSESEMGQHQPSWEERGPTDATSIMARLLEQDFMQREIVDDVPDTLKQLHPYATTLNANDTESCVKLENCAFPPEHRASREKISYRLNRCGECCFGIFTSADKSDPNSAANLDAPTAETANSPDSNTPDRKGVLLAHIIATKGVNDTIMDNDMEVPKDWRTNKSATPTQGHQEHGRNLMIHSLAVLPQYQRRALGSTLMKAYVQRMVAADIADRISLLAEGPLIPFYETLGFENAGKSKATFGGAEWTDMVLDLAKLKQYMDEEEET